jgi:hypothetical protein
MYRRCMCIGANTKFVHTHHVLPFAVYIGLEHGLLFDLLVPKTLFAVLLVFPAGTSLDGHNQSWKHHHFAHKLSGPVESIRITCIVLIIASHILDGVINVMDEWL